MPPGSEAVVTAGICVTTILMFLVTLPAALDAMIEKMNVFAVVGVPVIAPVVEFKLKPGGNVPLFIPQVIGVVPVAVSL